MLLQIALLYEAVTGVMPDYSRTPAAIAAAAQQATMTYPTDASPAPAPPQVAPLDVPVLLTNTAVLPSCLPHKGQSQSVDQGTGQRTHQAGLQPAHMHMASMAHHM